VLPEAGSSSGRRGHGGRSVQQMDNLSGAKVTGGGWQIRTELECECPPTEDIRTRLEALLAPFTEYSDDAEQ
jgi:hypothetical protein